MKSLLAWIVGLFVVIAIPFPVFAAASCAASVNPTNVTPSSTNTYTISLSNTGSDDIAWIKITRPSGNFTITGQSIGGWSADASDESITLTGSTMNSGGSSTLDFTATTGSSEAVAADWGVQASSDAGGADPASCGGSLGTSISSTPPDTSGPTMSDVTISDVADTSVKVSWTTDESATSSIDYGRTSDYGSNAASASLVTSHSLSLSGLVANTTYHFNVKGADSLGNNGESGDVTFVTAKAGTVGVTQTVTVTSSKTVILAAPTPIPDHTGPRITISTSLKKPFAQAPTIEGVAIDPSGVSTVEYSLDGGQNWAGITSLSKPGGTNTAFSATLDSLLDDNYPVTFRSIDTKGNAATVKVGILVIDRLAPVIGPLVVTIGPQSVPITSDGTITVVAGLPLQLTLSVAGGPVSVSGTIAGELVNFQKSTEIGVWSVAYKPLLAAAATPIDIVAKDGADHVTKRTVGRMVVLPSGYITSTKGEAIAGATITVFVQNSDNRQFSPWTAGWYGQSNPQTTKSDGGYSMWLPNGTYYLQVSAPGHQTRISQIFMVTTNSPLSENIALAVKSVLTIGPFAIPWFGGEQLPDVPVTMPNSLAGATPGIVGSQFPILSMPSVGDDVSTLVWRGQATILTFMTPWSPGAATQLDILGDIQVANGLVVIAFTQQSAAAARLTMARGGYTSPFVVDPDGTVAQLLGIPTLPTHIVMNKKGVIVGVKTGVLNKAEIIDLLASAL